MQRRPALLPPHIYRTLGHWLARPLLWLRQGREWLLRQSWRLMPYLKHVRLPRFLSLPKTDFALHRDDSNLFLPWIIGLLSFFATFALWLAMNIHTASHSWKSASLDSIAVHISAEERERAELSELATEIITGTQGVRDVRVLEGEEIAGLLSPWLGKQGWNDALPMPLMLEVRLEANAPEDTVIRLRTGLEAHIPNVDVDDHNLWIAKLSGYARQITLGILGFAALMVGTMFAVVGLIARSDIKLHDSTLQLLRIIGAQDDYIGRQFLRHMLALAFRGAVLGTLAALVLASIATLTLPSLPDSLLPQLEFTPAHLALLLFPLGITGLCLLTVRRSVATILLRNF